MELINFPVFVLHQNAMGCTIKSEQVNSPRELRDELNDLCSNLALGDNIKISERPE